MKKIAIISSCSECPHFSTTHPYDSRRCQKLNQRHNGRSLDAILPDCPLDDEIVHVVANIKDTPNPFYEKPKQITCSRCGKPPFLEQYSNTGGIFYYFECKECNLRIPAVRTIEEAIKEWGRE